LDDYEASQRNREIADLAWHWDGAYRITWLDGRFLAQRTDNRTTLTAETAAKLRSKIIADYSTNPVPR
jgi:hypothetical protein